MTSTWWDRVRKLPAGRSFPSPGSGPLSTLSRTCLRCSQTSEKSALRRGEVLQTLTVLGAPWTAPRVQPRSGAGRLSPGPAHTSSEGAGPEEAPRPATPLEEVGPLITEPVPCRSHLQQRAAGAVGRSQSSDLGAAPRPWAAPPPASWTRASAPISEVRRPGLQGGPEPGLD